MNNVSYADPPPTSEDVKSVNSVFIDYMPVRVDHLFFIWFRSIPEQINCLNLL